MSSKAEVTVSLERVEVRFASSPLMAAILLLTAAVSGVWGIAQFYGPAAGGIARSVGVFAHYFSTVAILVGLFCLYASAWHLWGRETVAVQDGNLYVTSRIGRVPVGSQKFKLAEIRAPRTDTFRYDGKRGRTRSRPTIAFDCHGKTTYLAVGVLHTESEKIVAWLEAATRFSDRPMAGGFQSGRR